jgi:hypothetical protein
LVALTVNTEEPPVEIEVGFALIETVAAGLVFTVTVAVAVAVVVAPTAFAV